MPANSDDDNNDELPMPQLSRVWADQRAKMLAQIGTLRSENREQGRRLQEIERALATENQHLEKVKNGLLETCTLLLEISQQGVHIDRQRIVELKNLAEEWL